MGNALTLAGLSSDLNSYFREYKEGIKGELQYGFIGDSGPMSMENRCTLIPGVVDELVLGGATVNDFLRQYKAADTNTFIQTDNSVVVGARTLKMRKFKGDLLFKDDVINTTFLMWQSKMKAINMGKSQDKEMAFVEYLFFNVIIKKALRSLRKASFQGVWDTGSGTAYASTAIVDGMEKKIADAISAGTLTAHAYNSSNNVVTEVEAAFDMLTSEQKRADDLVIALREDIYNKWIRANRSSTGLGRTLNFDSAGTFTIDGFPNTKVVPEPDLATYKAVIYQKTNYFISVTMDQAAANDWEFQRFDRTTKCMMNGEIGVEFETLNPGSFVNVAVMS